jgi:hypothetical protein
LKDALRQDVYEAIREFTLPCFWYAIHVAGLHEWYSSQEVISQDTKKRLQKTNGDSGSRIKFGSLRSTPVSMHVKLFLGLYGHLIAFFVKQRGKIARESGKQRRKLSTPICVMIRYFAGETLGVIYGFYCRNQKASFYKR